MAIPIKDAKKRRKYFICSFLPSFVIIAMIAEMHSAKIIINSK
jgi:hypothetical protein